MTSPFLLLTAPVLGALATFLVRRWVRVAAALGAGWLLLVGWLARGGAGLVHGHSWPILGRAFVLDDGSRLVCFALYLGLGLLFLLALWRPQGRLFVPISLLLLLPLTAALTVRPVSFALPALLVAAALLTILIQANQAGSAGGALRFLAMTAVATPLFLVAGWMIAADPGLYGLTIGRLVLVGFVILAAGFPFHLWVMPVVMQAPPLVIALLFGLGQLVIAAFSLRLLELFPVLLAQSPLLTALRWSGLATMIVAGLLALAAAWPAEDPASAEAPWTSGRRLLGYLLLLDIGGVVLAASQTNVAAVQPVILLLFGRFVSLVLAGLGLAWLEAERTARSRHGFSPATGLGLVLFSYGALSLIGLPLTPGFSGRWLVVTLAAVESPLAAALVVAAGAGATGALWRFLARGLGIRGEASESGDLDPGPEWQGILAGLALLTGLGLALFPQWLAAYARNLADLLQ